MRLKEGNERRKQHGIGRPFPQFGCPDSGQIEEPLRPPIVAKRCRKRGQGKGHWVIWRLWWHSLE
jgi:hypothetical protein